MVVGATDKAQNAEMENARLELLQKHQTSNMIMFGRLEYILLIATAGTLLQVEALAVRGPPALTTVVPAFTVRSLIIAQNNHDLLPSWQLRLLASGSFQRRNVYSNSM